jgi:hypothetical protein
LADVQNQWIRLARELDAILYIDALPAENALRQAILVLRQGDAWYRRFQSPWRSAVGVHASLQRDKKRLRAADRLEHLERAAELLQLREHRNTNPAWVQYLGFPAPAETLPLEGYVALAAWNRSALLEDLQAAGAFSPQELTPEKARTLRREFADLNGHLALSGSALQEIERLLPKLSEIQGGHAVDKWIELVRGFVETLETQIGWIETEVPVDVDLPTYMRACEAALERRSIAASVDVNQGVQSLLGEDFAGVETNVSAIRAALSFGQSIDAHGFAPPVKVRLRSSHPVEAATLLASALEQVVSGLQNVADLEQRLSAFGGISLDTWVGAEPKDNLEEFAIDLSEEIAAANRGCRPAHPVVPVRGAPQGGHGAWPERVCQTCGE